MHEEENLWPEDDKEQENLSIDSTGFQAAPPMYSADYLRVTCAAPPPIVSVGFSNGEPAYILRNRQGREVTRVSCTKENRANEKPRGFFHSLARLMYGSNR
jgi:hypothetical protein